MQLISAAIHGYKRFGQKSSINFDGKLIAIIGPNEAGKSSLLKALQHFNHHQAFIKGGASLELTRGLTIPDDRRVIQATFLLDQADKDAVAHIEDTSKLRWLKVYKTVAGTYISDALPRPMRDLSRRKMIVSALQDVLNPIRNSEIKVGPKKDKEPLTAINKLITDLSVENQELSKSVVAEIRSVAAMFLSSGLAAEIEALQPLSQKLDNLAVDEDATPYLLAIQILFKRKPAFLFFDDEARDLKSDYDLDEVGDKPPKALSNLMRVANLNLNILKSALSADDQGQVETIIDAANERLKQVFSTSWGQSDLTVRLRVSDQVLHILVRDAGTPYVAIAERSDGLRQYVSLLAFASLEKNEESPILLIDEAETHLHYDAQADLIQMLARQEVATKVIYTTHSVGCLPEDLGTGVRLVEANGPASSIIRNWFWETDEPGFSPMLFGIGAKTLAFMPVRFALITEGPTDIILLPSMFREATGKLSLGFQTVPGLSVADETDIGILENGAPRTAYLVDADKGGGELRRQLQHAGIPEGRIFNLPDEKKIGLVLEDFIDADLYLTAVNEEIRRSHGKSFSMSASELPVAGRPKAVEQWCKEKGIKPPSKRAVAYRIIEKRSEHQILSTSYQPQFKQLYDSIEGALALRKV